MRTELAALFRLGLPVALANFGYMAMGLLDTAMVGHMEEGADEALAAVGLGNVVFMGLHHFGMGVLLALDPLISQAVGARDEKGIRRNIQRGLILALALSIPLSALLIPAEFWMVLLDQPESVIPTARDYVWWSIPSMAVFLGMNVLRTTFQALHQLRPLIIVVLLANLLNAFLNWVFIYGHLGFPAMGARGSAMASSIGRWFQFLAALLIAWPMLRPYLRGSWRASFKLRPLLRVLKLGMPIGFQVSFELLAFASALLFMGWIGKTAQAGHQVTIQLAAFAFMLPLGLSQAASVRVGYAVGKRDHKALISSTRVALLSTSVLMLGWGALFLLLPGQLAGLFTRDPAVLAIATTLIPIAGAFQVVDGLQVVAAGCLRGMADTLWPMFLYMIGFWFIGAPVGLWLAFGESGRGPDGWPNGLWWGLAVGLTFASTVLILRIVRKVRTLAPRVE
jgi:MATE family, multidrug efflux pump